MHKWYDGQTPQCPGCGWFVTETWEDGKERKICRWFSSVFHSRSEDKCESFMTPDGVRKYQERQIEMEKRRKKK